VTRQEDLRGAFTEVRKAYRLLGLFQQQILDLAEQISGKLDRKFYRWLPSGDAEEIRATRNPARRPAWKMLPLNGACSVYLPRSVDANSVPLRVSGYSKC